MRARGLSPANEERRSRHINIYPAQNGLLRRVKSIHGRVRAHEATNPPQSIDPLVSALVGAMRKKNQRGQIVEELARPTEMEQAEEGTAAAGEPLIKYRGWRTMPFLMGNETFEKLATMGTMANLLVYLTSQFHLNRVKAVTALNAFHGTTNLATIIGAFISDSCLGRYATLAFASIAALLGMIIITLTAAVPSLHPAACEQEMSLCEAATPIQLGVLILSFIFLVIGSGGIRPCSMAFGADQFDPMTESGKRGINSFFNWYYFTLTIAVTISATIIIYIQSDVSWALGFFVPTVLMVFSCVFFFAASELYVKVRPEGSPVTSIIRVLVAAVRKRAVQLPDDLKNELYDPPHVSSLVAKLPHTNQLKFLDKAAVISAADEIDSNGLASNPWKLCSMQEVEEVKCLIRIAPIWSTGVIYYIPAAQQNTYVVFQAIQSNRHLTRSFKIPGASFTVFSSIALSIWIPVYDRLIVPLLHRITGRDGGFTLLQRMAIGILLSAVAMFVCGIVEERRRSIALRDTTISEAPVGGAVSAMSSFWLVPQLLLLGVSEAFNMVSQLEFYYKQFPENMRSIAGSLVFCGIAIASYLSGFMVSVVQSLTAARGQDWLAQDLNKGRLDLFYYLIGVIGLANLVYFTVCARWYRYKDDGDSDVGDSASSISRTNSFPRTAL